MFDRRALLIAAPALLLPGMVRAEPEGPTDWGQRLAAAARSQIGRTLVYDPAYSRIPYPNGDVPIERGVCTDVVIRAYRQAFGLDLQQAVHEDMAANFAAYPKTWGLKRADRNIDHRRVPNLETFLRRKRAALPAGSPWRAGDLLTQRLLPGSLPHILIATGQKTKDGQPLIIHNIGGGTQLEPVPVSALLVGHFRLPPDRA
jgi:uncharacterized protein YijF (DUF1287 family)